MLINPSSAQTMKEIRLCTTVAEVAGETPQPGSWTLETPPMREAFEVLVKAGNERYGQGTHWMEERHVRAGWPFKASSRPPR